MFTPVKQYNNHACFGACLESFLRDIDHDFSHKEFIKNNLDLFFGGTDIEGTCSTEHIPKVAERVKLKHEILTTFTPKPPAENEGILFIVFWNNSESEKHCVRFIEPHTDKSLIKVMNPNAPDKLMDMPISWIKQAHKFTKE